MSGPVLLSRRRSGFGSVRSVFAALGRIVVRARWWVIAAWIVTAVVIALTAPALQSTQDQSEFLPRHYESVKALTVQQEAFPERGEIGAIVVFDRKDASRLSAADQAEVAAVAKQLNTKSYDNLGTAVAAPVSENGLVQAIFVQVKPGNNAFARLLSGTPGACAPTLSHW